MKNKFKFKIKDSQLSILSGNKEIIIDDFKDLGSCIYEKEFTEEEKEKLLLILVESMDLGIDVEL